MALNRLGSDALQRYLLGFLDAATVATVFGSCCRSMRAEANAWLAALRELRLQLRGDQVAQAALLQRLATSCSALRVIELWRVAVRPAQGPVLDALRSLVRRNAAHLEDVRCTGGWGAMQGRLLDALATCRRLRRLVVPFVAVRPASEMDALQMAVATNAESLRELQAAACLPSATTGQLLAHLCPDMGNNQLRILALGHVAVKDIGWLAHAPRLESLTLQLEELDSMSAAVRALGAALRISGAAQRLVELTLSAPETVVFDDQRPDDLCVWALPALASLCLESHNDCLDKVPPWECRMPGCWRLRAPRLARFVTGLLLTPTQWASLRNMEADTGSLGKPGTLGIQEAYVATLDDERLLLAMAQRWCRTLTSLAADNLEVASDAALWQVLHDCERLTRLDLRCNGEPAPSSLVAWDGPQLERARLVSLEASAWSDGLASRLLLPALEDLSLCGHPISSWISLDALGACCPSLRHLRLHRVRLGSRQLPVLRRLELLDTFRVAGLDADLLASWLPTLPRLADLQVQGPPGSAPLLTQALWASLPRLCPGLRRLVAHAAPRHTDALAVANQAPADAAALTELFARLPSLKRVTFAQPASLAGNKAWAAAGRSSAIFRCAITPITPCCALALTATRTAVGKPEAP